MWNFDRGMEIQMRVELGREQVNEAKWGSRKETGVK